MKHFFQKYGWSLLAGIIALFIPLVRDLHIESALIASIAGTVIAVIVSTGNKNESSRDKQNLLQILAYVYMAAVPLVVFGLFWGCLSFDGLGYWIFYPSFSIYFAYSIGRYFRKTGFNHPLLFTTLLLLWVAIGEFLLEAYLLPQVYFFNHVWGGWPGPIYDEAIHFTFSVVYFRFITFCWATFFWILPEFWENRFAKWSVLVLTLGLGLSYANMTRFRIISPRGYIQEVLGGKKETAHFVFYYDKKYYSKWDINRYSKYAEFDLKQLTHDLDIPAPSHKIQCYFYANVWQKKALVGAKYTSYVPVWNPVDQLHIAKSAIDRVFRHELVHVLAKRFGNRWIHASWSIGLVEGLAVALSPDESQKATINQIVASSKPWPDARELSDSFSLAGFYSGRSTVNYVTAGSFVQYLLKHYPVDDFKKAYYTSNLPAAYPVSMDSLVAGWHRVLAHTKIDSVDQAVSANLFSIPSLFEEKCPHDVSHMYELYDHYKYNMAIKDTNEAIGYLNKGLKWQPGNESFWLSWSYLQLKKERPDLITTKYRFIDTVKANPIVDVRLADAYMMQDDTLQADTYLNRAKNANKGDNEIPWLNERLSFRNSKKNWKEYLDINYRKQAVDTIGFKRLALDNQLLLLSMHIDKNNDRYFPEFVKILLRQPVQKYSYDIYERIIGYAALKNDFPLAYLLIQKISGYPWRPREKQRLQKMVQFVNYLKVTGW